LGSNWRFDCGCNSDNRVTRILPVVAEAFSLTLRLSSLGIGGLIKSQSPYAIQEGVFQFINKKRKGVIFLYKDPIKNDEHFIRREWIRLLY